MTVYVYGLTYLDVIEEIPGIDASEISATTGRITTTGLNQYIEDGASQLNAMLERSGVTPDAAMNANSHQKIAAAVRSYAAFKSLAVLNVRGPAYDQCRRIWEQVYAELSNRPQMVGTAFSAGGIKSNILDSADEYGTTDWSFIGFRDKW